MAGVARTANRCPLDVDELVQKNLKWEGNSFQPVTINTCCRKPKRRSARRIVSTDANIVSVEFRAHQGTRTSQAGQCIVRAHCRRNDPVAFTSCSYQCWHEKRRISRYTRRGRLRGKTFTCVETNPDAELVLSGAAGRTVVTRRQSATYPPLCILLLHCHRSESDGSNSLLTES
jgi:hypothetical protein